MDRNINLAQVSYDNFIRYFETNYRSELSGKSVTNLIEFLTVAKSLALQHQRLYEHRHGGGSYRANLAKYGAFDLTPVQVIDADQNRMKLLVPKRDLCINAFGIRPVRQWNY